MYVIPVENHAVHMWYYAHIVGVVRVPCEVGTPTIRPFLPTTDQLASRDI